MTAFVWGQESFTQWAVDQKRFEKKCEWICYKGLDVTCFVFCFFFKFHFFLGFFFCFPFSMWFELLACRLLWVINTNEGVLFIFEILFWDVQAPCNRCLFIFIINNKSKDSLLFNPGLHNLWIYTQYFCSAAFKLTFLWILCWHKLKLNTSTLKRV